MSRTRWKDEDIPGSHWFEYLMYQLVIHMLWKVEREVQKQREEEKQ